MIRLIDVSKTFDDGATYAVEHVSLEVPQGETLVLLGSSGCGKTTTLKMVNRLIEASSGTVEVDGHNVLDQDPIALRRRIGYVFQGIGLFPHMTVEQNVALVLRLLRQPAETRRRRAHELLELVHLAPSAYAGRLPAELSGGEQQRVGVARALAADPAYLLMDEPFGALDAITRETLQRELVELKRYLTKTLIFVTHDIREAVALGDRIAVMDRGRLLQVGPPDEITRRPATAFVRQLFARHSRPVPSAPEAP